MPRVDNASVFGPVGRPSQEISGGLLLPGVENGLTKAASKGLAEDQVLLEQIEGGLADLVKDGAPGTGILLRGSSNEAVELLPKSSTYKIQGVVPRCEVGSGVGALQNPSFGLAPPRSIDELRHFLLETLRAEFPQVNPVVEEEGVKKVVGAKQKKAKSIKSKEDRLKCLLGVDISIENVMDLTEIMIVGRVRGRKYSAEYIADWAQTMWKESPGMPVDISILARG